jgi:hypothetical protein
MTLHCAKLLPYWNAFFKCGPGQELDKHECECKCKTETPKRGRRLKRLSCSATFPTSWILLDALASCVLFRVGAVSA